MTSEDKVEMENGVLPMVSIAMPTLNSEQTIRLALESITKQTYDKRLIEVLVADGGSTDRTREIAEEFGCTILDNKRVMIEDGKILALSHARGKYAILMDSDEVLCDPQSIEKKVRLLESHQEVRNIVTAGLLNPPGFADLNDYTNRYGEPFSFFLYRLDGGDYVRSLKSRYSVAYEDESILIVQFQKGDVLPICDAGGHCFDLGYLRDLTGADYVPSLFNRMAEETHRLAVIKGDFMLHYSTVSVKQLISKLRWRIITNVHRPIGNEGFVNREKYFPLQFRLKKYLYPLYAFTLVGPLIDALHMTLTKKNPAFLWHFPLAVYTAAFITWQYALKLLKISPRLQSYVKRA